MPDGRAARLETPKENSMLDPCRTRVYTRMRVTSWRALLAHVYVCQLSANDAQEAFDACFVWQRDARWCRRRIRCRFPSRTYVLWPPMTTPPAGPTEICIFCVAPHVYVPVVKRFMDPVTLGHCLALYTQ